MQQKKPVKTTGFSYVFKRYAYLWLSVVSRATGIIPSMTFVV